MQIYLPEDSLEGARPVVVYVPGGGMVSGDKRQTEVAWSCAGRFFARAGAVAIVVNYRLVPGVVYPGGGYVTLASLGRLLFRWDVLTCMWIRDDIRSIRQWVAQHIHKEPYRGDPNWLIIVGQSAGGTHVATDCQSSILLL